MIKKEEYQKGYEDGLKDAHNLAKKIRDMPFEVRQALFSTGVYPDILVKVTPQEAIKKIREYEEDKNTIKVGDVVFCFADCDDSYRENKEHYGVVTDIRGSRYDVVMTNGEHADFASNVLEKTGTHVDILKMLKGLV